VQIRCSRAKSKRRNVGYGNKQAPFHEKHAGGSQGETFLSQNPQVWKILGDPSVDDLFVAAVPLLNT
jgi:hypothetical protein